MSILKVIGKIGAVAAGGAALFLAGKSGLGESLFNSKDEVSTDDLEQGLQLTTTEDIVEELSTVETTETEGSD